MLHTKKKMRVQPDVLKYATIVNTNNIIPLLPY